MTSQPPQRAWVGDIQVFLVVLVAILLASWVADGTTRYVVLFVVIVLAAVLVRVGRRSIAKRRARA